MTTKLAIIQLSDSQLLVKEGEKISTFKYNIEKPFDTLLIVDGEDVVIGEPTITKGGVILQYLGDKKQKTVVRRFRNKSRYRKNKSHSDIISEFVVKSIDLALNENKIVKHEEEKLVQKEENKVKDTKKKPTITVKKVKVAKKLPKKPVKKVTKKVSK